MDLNQNSDGKNVALEDSKSPSIFLEPNLNERYTPNTSLNDFSQELFGYETSFVHDLSFKCKSCKAFIKLNELNHHKEFHDSLNFFGFTELPEHINQLNEKRKSFIKLIAKNIKKHEDLETSKAIEWNMKVSQINRNYELLKSYINNNELNRQIKSQIKPETRGESRIVSNDQIIAIGSCSIQNKSHCISMEDNNLILDNFGENENLIYIGIFDGYDGRTASLKCLSQLHLGLLHSLSQSDLVDIKFIKEKYEFDEINNLEKFHEKILETNTNSEDESNQNFQIRKLSLKSFKRDESVQTSSSLDFNNYEDPSEVNEKEFTLNDIKVSKLFRNSFKYAYSQMDKLLSRGRDEISKVRWSGVTTCNCIIEKRDSNTFVHIANCGDVEAILIVDNSSNPKNKRRNHRVLTRLHTFNSCIKDRDTIEKRGGKIIEVTPGQMRLNGLYSITRGLGFHGDKKIKNFISTKPTFRSYKIQPNHVCLVIATKGLWKVLNCDKVAEIVLQMLSFRRTTLADRPTSPSVKSILNQYNIVQNKEKLKDRSNLLETVQDNNENELSSKHDQQQEDKAYDLSSHSKNTNSNYDSINETESNTIISEHEYYLKSSRPISVNEENYDDNDLVIRKTSNKAESIKNEPLKNLNEETKDLDSEKLRSYVKKTLESSFNVTDSDQNINIVKRGLKIVNVTEYDLNKSFRRYMEDRRIAKRLDMSELIAESLASGALMAGSTDNISINCVLLPGSNL